MMKHEWKKHEKAYYMPKNKPEFVQVPEFKFFAIKGQGNPNDDFFGEYIGVLYSLSYAVKMYPKSGKAPDGYFDYTVYPLEGIWDITEDAKKNYTGTLDKNSLVFDLMMRQPDFVTEEFAKEIIEKTNLKKPHQLLDNVTFKTINENKCVQMLHNGSYDSEPESFAKMEEFCTKNKLKRKCKKHREIYPVKLAPISLKRCYGLR